MKKYLTAFFILVVVSFVGMFVFFDAKKDSNADERGDTAKEAAENNGDANGEKGSIGRYVIYEGPKTLDENSSKRRVLFFYANWCPTCRPADADFRKNENEFPEDVVTIRVNYNDLDTDEGEKELAKKYGITYQHTFVQIDSQGSAISRWNGGKTKEVLKNIK